MYLNTTSLLSDLRDNRPSTNPLVLKQELIESELIKKEDFLQRQVSQIFKDKKYYSPYQETAISRKELKALDLVHEAPQVPQQPDPNEAKAKTLQNKMNQIKMQQKNNANMNPQQSRNLEEKKMQIRAALEKLRIDSRERIANARIKLDRETGMKRTIAGGISSGLGAGIIPAAIGGTAWIASQFMGK